MLPKTAQKGSQEALPTSQEPVAKSMAFAHAAFELLGGEPTMAAAASAAAVDAAADGSCWGNTEGAFRTWLGELSNPSVVSFQTLQELMDFLAIRGL